MESKVPGTYAEEKATGMPKSDPIRATCKWLSLPLEPRGRWVEQDKYRELLLSDRIVKLAVWIISMRGPAP